MNERWQIEFFVPSGMVRPFYKMRISRTTIDREVVINCSPRFFNEKAALKAADTARFCLWGLGVSRIDVLPIKPLPLHSFDTDLANVVASIAPVEIPAVLDLDYLDEHTLA